MKKVVALLSVLCASMAVACVMLLAQVRDLQMERDSMVAVQATERMRSAMPALESGMDEMLDVEADSAALSTVDPAESAGASQAVEPSVERANRPRPARREMAALFSSPLAREMQRVNARVGSKRTYGALLDELKLSGEQADDLLGILADEQRLRREAFTGNRGDRAAAQQALDSARAQTDSLVASILTPSQYSEYEQYRNTLPERMQVSRFEEQLAAVDLPLSAEQKDGLLGILVDERGDGAGQSSLRGVRSAEEVEARLKEQAARASEVVSRASSVLDSAQLQIIKNHYDWQIESQRAMASRRQARAGRARQPE